MNDDGAIESIQDSVPFDLMETPLTLYSPEDALTIRDACEGIQIFGGTGSGKTSGSGARIAKDFLKAQFGGLVLVAKPDETALWQQYAKETGREDDLIIVSAENDWTFNFMDYEFSRPGRGSGLTENLVALFSTVTDVAQRAAGGGNNEEAYWINSRNQLLRNAIDLLALTGAPVSLPDIYEVIQSAPFSVDDLRDEEWRESSICFSCLVAVSEREEKEELTPQQRRDFQQAYTYWTKEFPQLSENTRSSIVSTFTSLADGFLRGALYWLFCTETNFTPEDTFEGKIIIFDLPIKEYNELGQNAQVLFKFVWQRAVERRDVKEDPRPVFLWADESQFFVTKNDPVFQTTARSARAATVYLTQNMPNYMAALGAEKAEPFVESLLGNLSTKIFHANTCAKTNLYAADLFGKELQAKANMGMSLANSQTSLNEGYSMDYAHIIQPNAFQDLRRGGPANQLQVDGFIHAAGRRFIANGANYLKATFIQGTP